MAKVHLLLLLMVIICALSVVTSQNKARKLFAELQKEKDRLPRQFLALQLA